MKTIKKDLSEISTHKYGRMDYKYWNTCEAVKFKSYFLLKDMFELINGSVQTSNYVQILLERYAYSEISGTSILI